MKAGVYLPPEGSGMPLVAVVVDNDGEVVVSQSVPTIASGEALIQSVFEQFTSGRPDLDPKWTR